MAKMAAMGKFHSPRHQRSGPARQCEIRERWLGAGAPLPRLGSPGTVGLPGQADGESDVLVAQPISKTRRPPMYKVILVNDDYTPMDFVVMVLEHIFRRSHDEALSIMLEVHHHGSGIAGIYTRDVAETKIAQVAEYARINEYPLQCTLEPEH